MKCSWSELHLLYTQGHLNCYIKLNGKRYNVLCECVSIGACGGWVLGIIG